MRRTEVEIEVKNATANEVKAFTAAAEWYEKAINSQDFWAGVQAKYGQWEDKLWLKEKKRYQNFQEFKEMVLDGANRFEPEVDFKIRVHVTLYYSWKATVGYTYPSTWWTWFNRKFLKGFDLGDIAGNQAHEELHNEGMDHPYTNINSAVYQFGYELRDWVKRELKLAPVSYPPVKYRRSIWSRVVAIFRGIF